MTIDTPEFRKILSRYDQGDIPQEVLITFIDAHTEKVRQEQKAQDEKIAHDFPSAKDGRVPLEIAAAIRSQK